MLMVESFSFVLFLAYALLMLMSLHDKNQSNICFVNVFRNSANALLSLCFIKFISFIVHN